MADVDRAKELYRSGWSLKRVATELGVTAETIRQAFLKNDVQIRPRPGRPAV